MLGLGTAQCLHLIAIRSTTAAPSLLTRHQVGPARPPQAVQTTSRRQAHGWAGGCPWGCGLRGGSPCRVLASLVGPVSPRGSLPGLAGASWEGTSPVPSSPRADQRDRGGTRVLQQWRLQGTLALRTGLCRCGMAAGHSPSPLHGSLLGGATSEALSLPIALAPLRPPQRTACTHGETAARTLPCKPFAPSSLAAVRSSRLHPTAPQAGPEPLQGAAPCRALGSAVTLDQPSHAPLL